MSHTPTKNDNIKKLPMIVDIAIGNDGKQLYQVHESSKLVRKEMPRSTNFTTGSSLTHEEEKTPIRKILGTISPSTLNQKKLSESDFMEPNLNNNLAATSSLNNIHGGNVGMMGHYQTDPHNPNQSQLHQQSSSSSSQQYHLTQGTPQMEHRKISHHDEYPSVEMVNGVPIGGSSGIASSVSGGHHALNNGMIVGGHPQGQLMGHQGIGMQPGLNLPMGVSSATPHLQYPMDPHQQLKQAPLQHSPNMNALNSASSTSTDNADIWSMDVEAAFEEVLSIIPKNGLSKIKISGRSCGRNELISDYILQKTGKFRTRKQVSSHIQVIKNLGQKAEIIKLINDGPIFATEEERDDNMNKFEEIFSKITLAKSMGVGDTIISSSKRSLSLSNATTSSGSFDSTSMSKRKKLSNLSIENFYLAIRENSSASASSASSDKRPGVDNDGQSSGTFTLTRQGSMPVKNLKLKEDANLSTRFPGLNDFTTLDIPFIHNMVNMKVPKHDLSPDFESLTSNYLIRSNSSAPSFSNFSCVYSFGQEVLKTNEISNFNENSSFMLKFWNFFFKELLAKNQHEINTALKGITIKQIIYESDLSAVNQPQKSTHLIPKSKIQAVLLWEFAAVDNFSDAYTTTSRLTLPKPIYQQKNQATFGPPYSNDIVPQSIEYQQTASSSAYPKYAQVGAPANGGGANYSPTPSTSTTFNTSTGYRSGSIQPTTGTKTEYGYSPMQPDVKPQVNVQHKFQTLQEMQQLNSYQQPFNSGSNVGSVGIGGGGLNNSNYVHPSVGIDLMMPNSEVAQQQSLPQQSHQTHPLEHSNVQMYQFGGLLVNPNGNNDQSGFMNVMDNTYVGK